jgi:predicted dehydrogenase
MLTKIRVAVIGCGYWGPNLIRNFNHCPRTDLIAACDANPERLNRIGVQYPSLTLTRTVDELLGLDVDAVAIATPVSTHYPLAKRCFEAGLHVLVEKPLANSVAAAQAMVDLAAAYERVLMVDHTYLFGNPIRKVKELIDNDELGELNYIDGVRINLGLFQSDINVVWDLAPHDLSIMDTVVGQQAQGVSAYGCAHADQAIEDVAYLNLDFGNQLMANFHVNWLSPLKVRQMIFAGKRRSLVFNELNQTEPIKVYDRGIDISHDPDSQRRMQIGYHSGDIFSPRVEPGEALQTMVAHFAECIADGIACQSDGEMGLRVVRYLDAASRSIANSGRRIAIGDTAIVFENPDFLSDPQQVNEQLSTNIG